jgi:MtN3 and saliva related transmembrane protein
MDATQLIGIAASVGTGLYLLPQLIKLFKEKKAEQLSVGMMAVLLGGLILWIIYGVRKEDPIIIISNAISLVLNISIMVLTMKYSRKTKSN